MTRSARFLASSCLCILVGVASSCDRISGLPLFNTVLVELVNDTGGDVDPRIRFDDDPGFFAGLFPSEELRAGLLAPGEIATFPFDCDALGTIYSDSAELIVRGRKVDEAEDSAVLERDDEFDCGDVIRFLFTDRGREFGVIVTVNGRIVG